MRGGRGRLYHGLIVRIGTGFDAHRFVEGRPLVIGGVTIPHPLGLEGHSDSDVLLHAICDALLGAAALGDIGKHFPPSDMQYKGISSLLLFEKTVVLLAAKGYRVNNIDSVIIAEEPKMAPHIVAMCRVIAEAAGIAPGQVSVKATTTERMGFTGRKEGIAAHAVCTIVSVDR